MKLSEIAVVSRYSDAREQTQENELVDGNGFVWHEVKPDNLDPFTGFVMPQNLAKVRLYRKPGDSALLEGDIVMVFQGSPTKIGQVGLVIDTLFAVPSRVLCIIRGKGIDPLVLYFWLSRNDVMKNIASSAKFNPKNGKAFLSLDSIRDYETELDLMEESQNIAKAGRELIEDYKNSRKKMLAKMTSISELFSG